MKKIFMILMALAVLFSLCACKKKCDHEWVDASCKAPKTCAKCGETEGEKTSHLMKNATCTEPKTCSVCGLTEGEMPTGHNWVEATCTSPKYCTACNAAEGEVPGHKWVDNGKGSKTCSVCGMDDGSGTVSMSYTKYVTVDLSDGKAYLNYANPNDSTQDTKVQLVLNDKVLAKSDKLEPGSKLTQMGLETDAAGKLQTGNQEGKLVICFYNRTTGEQSLLNTEIAVTIQVQK